MFVVPFTTWVSVRFEFLVTQEAVTSIYPTRPLLGWELVTVMVPTWNTVEAETGAVAGSFGLPLA